MLLKHRLIRAVLAAGFAAAVSSAGVFYTAFAQAVDSSLVEAVRTAFTQTAAVDSVTLDSRSVVEVSGLPAGFSFGQEMTRTASLVRAGDAWNFTSTSTSALTTPQGETRTSSEVITIDGITYIRFTDVPAELSADLPSVWTDAASLTAANGMNAVSIDELLGEISLPVAAENVTSINELPGDTIEGQSMRVIQITLNPESVLESSASALVGGLAGGIGGGPGGFTPDGQFPQPPEGVTPPESVSGEVPELSPEDFQITFAVYIGADDGFIHRIYRVITVAPSAEGGISPAFTTTTLTDYAGFNSAVELNAPTLGE